MAKGCIQCPDGSWVCGEALVLPDCGPPGGGKPKYGEFTVKGETFEVYIRAHPRDKKEMVVEIRPKK